MAGLLRVAAGAAGRSGPAAGRLSLLQLQPAHGGRPRACRVGSGLAAASAGLPWPGEPHLVLRHAITVLREQRGDSHPTIADLDRERIHRKPVLSGLINEYTRAA